MTTEQRTASGDVNSAPASVTSSDLTEEQRPSGDVSHGDRPGEPVEAGGSAATEKNGRKKRGKTRKPGAAAPKEEPLGSARGVDTMLRNVYRTNLDMTTLADNKANMLISVNGLILSVMIATGGLSFVMSTDRAFLMPFLALTVTSFFSMLLAIFVARPRMDSKRRFSADDFREGRANVLLFLHYHSLSPGDYLDVIEDVMKDRQRLYRDMAAHLFGMGRILATKFRLLRWSYGVFVAGMAVTVILFSGVYAFEPEPEGVAVVPGSAGGDGFLPFDGIYEPSAVHQLADGRLLVLEDERDRPMNLLSIAADGTMTRETLWPKKQFGKKGPHASMRELSDLEGMDVDRQGYVYAITSHSRREGDGERQPDRDKLVRMRIDGDRISEAVAIGDLVEHLKAADPLLAKAEAVTNANKRNGLNIEGLALTPAQESLLIGFRSPLTPDGDKALIATVENIQALFDGREPPKIGSRLIELDLDGGGIRDITYVPNLKGFLIISGRANKKKVPFRLWFWDGNPQGEVRPASIEGVSDLKKAEGIAPVRINGRERLVIVSDDGKEDNDSPARFLLFDYDRLRIGA